jgi:hypothetical protein
MQDYIYIYIYIIICILTRGPFAKFVDSPYYSKSEVDGSGWIGASLAKGRTSKRSPSPHLHKVPTRSNKVNPRTLQTALVHSRGYVMNFILPAYGPNVAEVTRTTKNLGRRASGIFICLLANRLNKISLLFRTD